MGNSVLLASQYGTAFSTSPYFDLIMDLWRRLAGLLPESRSLCEGCHQEIADYCMRDVKLVREIYYRIASQAKVGRVGK